MHKVRLGGYIFEANDGEKLSELLIRNKFDVQHPCGGRGTCKKCKVKVNGRDELSCRYEIKSDIEVELYDSLDIESESGVDTNHSDSKNVCLALDIGTTTLALSLVSFDDKKAIKVITATNPQRAFGADVITRIDYCRKNSVLELKNALIEQINSMIRDIGCNDVGIMYVSGNTTMLHIFFGVDCSSIGVAPYTPVFLEEKHADAKALGIVGVERVVSLQGISSFVGADIVAGLNYIGMPEDDSYYLLLDLGTNAEIVLFSKNGGVATAAAAGPCFEGANISCGMSATRGAVYSFEFLDDGTAKFDTIMGEKAAGICGTGLIDIVSELLRHEIIDETGYMEQEEFVLDDGVWLSDADVRQYQLAKSAVCSAILVLMDVVGIDFDRISKLFISGGFSAKINVKNAVASGLLPLQTENKTVAINNSSLLGTIKFACEGGRLLEDVSNIKYIDLSANPQFADLFVENMMFELP